MHARDSDRLAPGISPVSGFDVAHSEPPEDRPR